MNCEKCLILIEDLLDGELAEEFAGELAAHLPGCAACAAHYRIARREKEIYAGYLNGVEPPADLWAAVQSKIVAAAPVVTPVPAESAKPPVWKTALRGLFRPAPALAAAAVLVAAGLGLAKFVAPETPPADAYAVKPAERAAPPAGARNPETAAADQRPAEVPEPPVEAPKISKRAELIKTKQIVAEANDAKALKNQKRVAKPPVAPRRPPVERAPDAFGVELAALEKAAAAQIEKTELLLRAFRNARLVEGGAVYDVGYERGQARRLLEKNVALRRTAENYGDLYIREILDRIEPLLLDIANLENNALPEKVVDIQKRVKNQNIIASLQTY